VPAVVGDALLAQPAASSAAPIKISGQRQVGLLKTVLLR
jgi:hypothetical protein